MSTVFNCRYAFIGLLLTFAALPLFAASEVTGTTPGGAAYRIAVPDGWQAGGPLVVLQHGYHQEPDRDPDLGPLLATQLASGYAVAASGYRQSGWALFTAIEDNAELIAEFTRRFGAPGPLYSVGGSMGGLTALKFAEDPRFRDRTRGVLQFCAVDDGVASWDFAFDLRLIYDDICRDSSGELAQGDAPFPWAFNLRDIPGNLGAFDLGNIDLLRALADVARCTGIGIPAFLRSGAQLSRLAQLQQLSGIGNEDFLMTNLAYATFGLGDLLRAPDKLSGRNPFFNETLRLGLINKLSYGNTVLEARIRRVRQEDAFARFDFERSSRPDGNATARIVSIRTNKDELTASGSPNFGADPIVPRIYPGPGRVYAAVVEAVPSHCGFTPAELHAGWDALIAPVLESETLNARCLARLAQGVQGPCRITTALGETVAMRDRTPIAAPKSAFSGRVFSSGIWFDPQRDGEGIVIEELGLSIGHGHTSPAKGRGVLVGWYTFAPPGDPNPGPRWLIGIGFQTGQGVHVPSMTMTRGARFGSAFNPADVVRTDWGSLSLTVDVKRDMQVRYDGPPGWEGSQRNLVLLANVDLNATAPPSIIGLPPPDAPSIVSASGTYFNPARDGEGIQFQLIPGTSASSKRAIAVFYTYDTQGRQLWLTGVADHVFAQANEVTFQMTRASGGVFGDSFNPTNVQRTPWGTLTLTLQSQPAIPFSAAVSRVVALRWNSLDPAFGSGGYPLTRLTRVGSSDPREF